MEQKGRRVIVARNCPSWWDPEKKKIKKKERKKHIPFRQMWMLCKCIGIGVVGGGGGGHLTVNTVSRSLVPGVFWSLTGLPATTSDQPCTSGPSQARSQLHFTSKTSSQRLTWVMAEDASYHPGNGRGDLLSPSSDTHLRPVVQALTLCHWVFPPPCRLLTLPP